ncbi:NXPE family member 3-like [Esox lucius]|uniref:NXPE C-terminal domain-containing protein n=1 Tax=Esox lucius TaxID=8010 RepID=A0A3P9AHX6_ESOLU|nr:NXPE family member 3-like [Esox lucius]
MMNFLSKYACVFYLLVLLTLLFHNFITLDVKWKSDLHPKQVQLCFQSTAAANSTLEQYNITSEGLSHLEPKQSFCSHLGQEPSPEEALKERNLLESISWSEPPQQPTPTPIEETSDPAHSHFVFVPAEGGKDRYVGAQLEARVFLKDFNGRPKSYGGDFLLARLQSPELGAGVAGQVIDHNNGSYSAIFPLLWEGTVRVEVTLVHPSEAITVLRRLREERPDRVLYKSMFRSGLVSETTMCNLCLPTSQQPVCNYTDILTGEPWYCYKPKQDLSCDNRINHFRAGYQNNLITDKETLLFQRSNLKARIYATGSDTVTVLSAKQEKLGDNRTSEKEATVMTTLSGYYFKWSWRSLGGAAIREYNDPADINQCLKGKVVNMYGDSTVRQYYEFLTSILPELKEFNLGSPVQAGPFMAVDMAHNIMLNYRSHGPPISYLPLSVTQLRYVANELDGLVGGSNTVVIISVWAHFTTFPVEVYIRRLRHIQRAVVRLLERAPETTVVVRSANLRSQSLQESLVVSDWFAAQLDRVLRAMFQGVDVLLLDAWEMTLAHHLPHNIHPSTPIIKNMINTILSHVCPEKN